MKKRILSILLAIAVTVTMAPAVSAASAQVSGSKVTNDKPAVAKVRGYKFAFDFKDLTTGSNKSYCDRLAIASSLFSTDYCVKRNLQDLEKIEKAPQAEITNDTDYVLEQVGFRNLEKKTLYGKYETDKNDYVVFDMGRRKITIDGKKYVVYVLSVRGTVQPEEWESDMDVGADTEEYSQLTGEHPDWIHRECHKGFDIIATRVQREMDSYMESFSADDKGCKKSILITGHSRGAAAANLLGRNYEDMYNAGSGLRPYTYTYGTPTTTTASKSTAAGYKTIFNILNEDDVVTYVPLPDWGFRRYGTDRSSSVEYDKDYKYRWKADGGARMLLHFTEDYLLLLKMEQEENADSFKAQDADTSNITINEYQSAEGSKVCDALTKIFPGNSEEPEKSRESIYKNRDLVWIPDDLPIDYNGYYEEVPYGSLPDEDESDLTAKAEFDAFALSHGSTRARISPAFTMHAVSGIIYAAMSSKEGVDIDEFRRIIREGDWDCLSWDDPLADLKALVYIGNVSYEPYLEDGDKYKTLGKDMAATNVMRGLVYSHMPTTYYFITNQWNNETVHVGDTLKYKGCTYIITSCKNKTAAFKKSANYKSVTVQSSVKLKGKTFKVNKIYSKAFAGKKTKSVTVKTKKLTKTKVKGSLKGSNVKTIKVSVGSKSSNRKYVKKYRKYFTKKNTGRKVTVK